MKSGVTNNNSGTSLKGLNKNQCTFLWCVKYNWVNNAKPPTPLPASSAIVIDHAPGGQCVLNIAQSLSPGSSFTVNAGKNLMVQGSLTIQ
jgi:hypothetical protein